jgi:DUF917 family protein
MLATRNEVATDAAGLNALVFGGAVLGGGGGGTLEDGIGLLRLLRAEGVPAILPLAAMAPHDTLVTLSGVGHAGTPLRGRHFLRALELFEPFAKRRIAGMIASEVGPLAVTYGLLESVRCGLPVVDAPANGRAHPLFSMGALGLHRHPERAMETVAVGGEAGGYVELAVRANAVSAARIVRERVARDGIALAVVRNALPAAYVARHAAVGALAYAQLAGRMLVAARPRGIAAVLSALAAAMGGRRLGTGRIIAAALQPRGGFMVGILTIARPGQGKLHVSVCNEYIVVTNGRTLAAFPDLITLFDHDTALPLASSEAMAGRLVSVFAVPRGRLILGSPMRDAGLLARLDGVVGDMPPKHSSAGPAG